MCGDLSGLGSGQCNILRNRMGSAKIIQMLGIVVCLLATVCAKVTSNLYIVTYSPLYLNLTFSQPISIPVFQLLFNEIPINYKVLTDTSSAATNYLIQGNLTGIVNPADYIIEKYVLIFSEPLLAAGGNLDLNSFVLRAQTSHNQTEQIIVPIEEKNSYYPYQHFTPSFDSLAIVIVSITYFLSLTTVIGINAYHFLVIYCYISLQSDLFTALSYKIAYYMLFQLHQVNKSEIHEFVYINIPYMVIGIAFLIGLGSRVFLKKLAKRSGFWNETYYFLSYKLFINCWELMILPVFVNVIHLVQDSNHFFTIPRFLVYLYIYFGVTITALYSYSAFHFMNPQLGESYEHWVKYVDNVDTIQHFQMFEGYHACIDPYDWKKRNYHFFRSIERVLIMIFVAVNIIQVPNLLFQIMHLIYLFTIRPFKFDFFNYSNISMQIFVVLFYLYQLIISLYTGISDEVTTSTDITRILLSYIVILCLMIFSYFCLGIYEFYERLKFFKINMEYFNNKAISKQRKRAQSTVRDEQSKSIFHAVGNTTSKLNSSSLEQSKNSKRRNRRKKSSIPKVPHPDKVVLTEMTPISKPKKLKEKKESLLQHMAEEE